MMNEKMMNDGTPYMSHGTDMIEGRSADVTHLAIHGKVTVKLRRDCHSGHLATPNSK